MAVLLVRSTSNFSWKKLWGASYLLNASGEYTVKGFAEIATEWCFHCTLSPLWGAQTLDMAMMRITAVQRRVILPWGGVPPFSVKKMLIFGQKPVRTLLSASGRKIGIKKLGKM